jgi:hypothetical protein
MSQDRVARLREGSRHLQRQHLERYEEALRNQAAAIEMQREWQRVGGRRLSLLVAFMVVFLVLAFGLPWLLR